MDLFAFSTPIQLSVVSTSRGSVAVESKSKSWRSTATPPQVKVSKPPSLAKSFQIMPKGTPVSERPLPPLEHRSIPYVGFFFELFFGTFKGYKPMFDKYGKIFRSNFFLGPMFYIGDYHAVGEISRNPQFFTNKNSFPGLIELVGEDSMLATDGVDHQIARSSVAPAFAVTLFDYYLKTAAKLTTERWNRVHDIVEKDGSILFEPLFREHYLGITIEMTSGVRLESERSKTLRRLFSDANNAIVLPGFTPGRKKGLKARDEILAILREVILENLKDRADTINKLREYGEDLVKLGSKDIPDGDVNMLLVSIANSSLSTNPNHEIDEELVASLCRTFLLLWFGGYTTAAATSTTASFELGFRPDLMRKLIEEQDELVRMNNGDKTVTYKQTTKMPYLEAFLFEMLRLHPSVPSLARITTEDMEILGRYVPKNSRVLFDIKALHLDEAVYPNPHELIPERWLQKPKPLPILSFGSPGSPHYCIGAAFAKTNMKLTFASLLRDYTYTLDPSQPREYQTIPDDIPKSRVRVIKFERRH